MIARVVDLGFVVSGCASSRRQVCSTRDRCSTCSTRCRRTRRWGHALRRIERICRAISRRAPLATHETPWRQDPRLAHRHPHEPCGGDARGRRSAGCSVTHRQADRDEV